MAFSSEASHSSVDDDLLPGHEGRIVGREKEHHAGNLVGGGESPLEILATSARCAAAAASAGRAFSMIPESVGPGLMAFTRTPCSTSSAAAVRARERSAAFEAA